MHFLTQSQSRSLVKERFFSGYMIFVSPRTIITRIVTTPSFEMYFTIVKDYDRCVTDTQHEGVAAPGVGWGAAPGRHHQQTDGTAAVSAPP